VRLKKSQQEYFTQTVIKEVLSCYGYKKRGFLSEVSQLAIEGIVLTINEFLKEVAPAIASYLKENLAIDLEDRRR